jgi:hypothetical protein
LTRKKQRKEHLFGVRISSESVSRWTVKKEYHSKPPSKIILTPVCLPVQFYVAQYC